VSSTPELSAAHDPPFSERNSETAKRVALIAASPGRMASDSGQSDEITFDPIWPDGHVPQTAPVNRLATCAQTSRQYGVRLL